MARKKSRAQYTSKGERRSVSKWVTKSLKRDITPMTRLRNQVEAWKKGKNVVLTVPNPNKNEKAKRFIKKNAKEVWGKYQPYLMKTSS